MKIDDFNTIHWRSAKDAAIGVEFEADDLEVTFDLDLEDAAKLKAQLQEHIIKEHKQQK